MSDDKPDARVDEMSIGAAPVSLSVVIISSAAAKGESQKTNDTTPIIVIGVNIENLYFCFKLNIY
jgi:hypothetical protein